MSLRYEQYSSLKKTREFLEEVARGPRMPTTTMRQRAFSCLRHFPFLYENGQPMWSKDEFTKDYT